MLAPNWLCICIWFRLCICICTAGNSVDEKLSSALCRSKGMCRHQPDYIFVFIFVLQGNLLVRSLAALCKSKGMRWHRTDWSLIYNLRLMVRNTLEVQAPPNKQTNSQTVCPYHWLSSRTNSKNWREKSFIAACPLSCHIQEKKKLPFPPFIKEDNV